jgi:O-antigen/teichoic acid export membrane protein
MSDAVQMLQLQLAILLLGMLATTVEVGLLRVAMTTAVITAVPVTVVNVVVLPSFAKLHSCGERKQLQRLVTHSARLQFAGVLILTFPLFVAAGPLLGLVFGRDFAVAELPLRILAAGQLIGAAFGPNAPLLNMTGKERRVLRGAFIGLGVNLVLLSFLARAWGGVGAAVAIVAGQLCWNFLLWVDAKRLLGIETTLIGRDN